MRQTTRTLASLWWTSLLLIGLPTALVRLAGSPLPTHPPTRDEWAAWLQQPLTRATLVDGAALLAWAMWAALLAVVLASAYRWIARLCHHLPDIRLPGPLQSLSAAMLGTVAVSTSVAAASPPAAAHAAVAAADTTHPARPDLAGDPDPSAPTPPRLPAASADQPRRTVTVRHGDTLWDIAGAWLGEHGRWPEIYRLNADRYDQHGRMRHGDHIEPGWVLVLPDDARPPAGAAPVPPSPPAGQQPAPPVASAPPTPPTPGASGPVPSAPASTAPCPPATVAPTVAPTGPAAGGAPGATPAPTGTGSAVASPSPAANVPPSSRSPRANPPGVSLPGGSWVDLGLAAAIAAAAALVWIQRRRRYRPRPPSPTLRLDDPDLAPMPPVVTQVRRGLRRALHPTGDDADERQRLPAEPAGPADADAAGQPEPAPEQNPAPVPVAPALDHPLLEVWPPAGLGLVGPGGEAAARGFLVAALAGGGREEPEARGRVVIPAATLATLLGTQAVTVADTGRLTVTPGLPEALDVLDEQTLHRTRLVFDHEVDTVAALRDADPLEEPLPALLLIADAAAVHERARIAALLTQGQRLDIHGVLLGEDGRRVVAGPPVGVVGLEPFQVADPPDVVTNPAGVPVAGHRPGAGDLLGERDGLHRAGAGVPAAARVAHLPGRWQATRAPKVPSSGMRAASPRTREPRDGMVRSNGMLMIIGGPVGLVGTNQDGIRPGPRQRWVPASGAVGSASGSCAR